jgi:hypothetical protein
VEVAVGFTLMVLPLQLEVHLQTLEALAEAAVLYMALLVAME